MGKTLQRLALRLSEDGGPGIAQAVGQSFLFIESCLCSISVAIEGGAKWSYRIWV